MTLTPPAGFRFGGVRCGIKATGRPDLALLLAERDAVAAAVFTQNRVKAAPVLLSRERIRAGRARGVLVNSGNANACTGAAGRTAAETMVRATAEAAGIPERRLLVASTGVIGVPLPVEKIVAARAELLATTTADASGFARFAEAILTTDKGPKIAAAEVALGRKRVRLVGCCKGAGMIAPNMATTLGFVTTDAALEPAWARAALRTAADRSFNEVSVDGDTSTNDSLFLLASGRADNTPLGEGSPAARLRAFAEALREVLEEMAAQIVADGEGASKVVSIEVRGAADETSARAVARRVGASPLVKTALFGCDPNWGRILGAIGNAGVPIDPERIDVDIGEVPVVRRGVGVAGVEERAHAVMKAPRYAIRIHLHRGSASGRHLTCDLGYDYVKCNADYRT